ncbi:hypothetical protein BJ165DRAFT_1448383 [Panaeolus papilionaceus]|nr:hypothetical protein BJ165DRAFT_1448383 [Panaeolus papilionaceus]
MVQITSTLVVASLLVSSVLAVPISHVDQHKEHAPELAERTIHAHKKHHHKKHSEQQHEQQGHGTATQHQNKLDKRTVQSHQHKKQHHKKHPEHENKEHGDVTAPHHDHQQLDKRAVTEPHPDAKHQNHQHQHHDQHAEHPSGTADGPQEPAERHHEQFSVRADEVEAFTRAFNDIDIEEISARDPSLGSFFKKVKKTVSHIVTPKNIATVAKFAPLILREDQTELLGRALEHPSFQKLAERDPSFGSFFKKVKKAVGHVATPKNLMKAAAFAPLILREDEMDAFTRAIADDEVTELAAREPSFGSFFKKVKKIATPHNIAKAVDIASKFIPREDGAEVVERDLAADEPHDIIARTFVEYDLDNLD